MMEAYNMRKVINNRRATPLQIMHTETLSPGCWFLSTSANYASVRVPIVLALEWRSYMNYVSTTIRSRNQRTLHYIGLQCFKQVYETEKFSSQLLPAVLRLDEKVCDPSMQISLHSHAANWVTLLIEGEINVIFSMVCQSNQVTTGTTVENCLDCCWLDDNPRVS